MIKAPDGRAAVLHALERSGLSMAEFCRRRGLVYGTVAGWRSMERRVSGRFVEVEATGGPDAGTGARSRSAALCAELVLPGGAVLRIYQAGDQGGAA